MRATYIFALAMAALARLVSPARAQCGEAQSSCWTCHETQATHSVLADPAPWHRDHAFADVCSRCHGGDPLASDQAGAHAGILDPLADPRATCAGCHPDDADARARTYAASAAAAGLTSPLVSTPTPAPAPTSPARTAVLARDATGAPNDRVLALVVIGLAIVSAATIALVERRRRGQRMSWSGSWSPYVAGSLLGVVVTISLAVFGRRLSGAGAYQSLSGYVGAHVAPRDPYWTSIVRTGMTWDVWLLLGTFAGAFASAAVGRQLHLRTMPDARWIEAFGPRVARRWALVFVGTAMLSIAAGVAGGCTASLVLSGGAVLAPGAFVFMAAMFAGGAVVAIAVERRARRGRR